MEGSTVNRIKEMKHYLEWISANYNTWRYTWDGFYANTTKLDQIEIIEELRDCQRYPQLLNLVLDRNNEIEDFAVQAVIEEILETWEKEQWDEVVEKIIARMKKSEI